MNIAIKNINNKKSFDSCMKPQSLQVSSIGNKFARTSINDCFCKINDSVSFQGHTKGLGNVILNLERLLVKDEALIAQTKCKVYTPEGKAKNITVFITHRIFQTGHGMPDQEFYRLLSSNGDELGAMRIFSKIKENMKYGTKTDEPITNSYLILDKLGTIGAQKPNAPKSELKYSGLGTTLVKMAVQRSIEKGSEGRVKLSAIDNSHCFHYRNYFRVSEQRSNNLNLNKIENKITQLIRKSEASGKTPKTENVGSIEMYLPRSSVKILLNKGEKIELL